MIEEDQKQLIQFSEEKVALAGQCYDLVEIHSAQIDKDIELFDNELQAGTHGPAVPCERDNIVDTMPWRARAVRCSTTLAVAWRILMQRAVILRSSRRMGWTAWRRLSSPTPKK
jgi:Inhibitor of growth proteins N-terminal histone-binding